MLRQSRVKSSAYSISIQGEFISSAMSLIVIRKRVTEMMEPCGTSFSWQKESERLLKVLTWKMQWLRKFVIRSSIFPFVIILFS
jgi:hypothetical protein